MSLLDDQNLIEIKLYYKYVDVDNGKRLVILENNKAQKLLDSPDQTESIETLITSWSLLTWKEQNEVMNLSSQVINPQTGERQFNFIAYRDAIIKRCLRTWDIVVDGKPVPVTPIDAPGQLIVLP